MSRREFSKPVRRDAFVRAEGKCESCQCRIKAGAVHYDHMIPDALGGEPTLSNCQVLCPPCHRAKTRTKDIPAIAKTKRIQDQERGIRKSKGAPMPGTRASGIRKRMDGTVERRT